MVYKTFNRAIYGVLTIKKPLFGGHHFGSETGGGAMSPLMPRRGAWLLFRQTIRDFIEEGTSGVIWNRYAG
ncbi:hypothetical protein GIX45_00065 [Erwinia sp. CPCC 100877]|nr:hypothetical protein [Erwinia sp. CPCC 100877]